MRKIGVVFLFLLLIPISSLSSQMEVVKLPSGPICPIFTVLYPDRVPPNAVGNVTVAVRNIGDPGICKVEFLSYSGAILSSRELLLSRNQEGKVTYEFTMPDHPLKLVVRSSPYGEGYDYVNVFIATKEYKPQGVILSSSLWPSITKKESSSFSITFINIGTDGQINVNWSVGNKVVCKSSHSVANMKTATSSCVIVPPRGKKEFNVSVTVFSSAGITDSLSTKVHVVDAYPIPKITGYELAGFEFGKQGKLSINIENAGNASGPVGVYIYASPPYGRSILLASKMINLSNSALVDFYIPVRPLSSWYYYMPLSVKACSLPSVCDTVNIKANITSVPRVAVTFFNVTTKGVPLSAGYMTMEITNMGNAPANLRLEVSNATDILLRKDFSVSAGGKTRQTYSFVIPPYNETLDILLMSGSDVIFSRSVMIRPFLPPDAVFVKMVNLTSKAVVGSSSTIALTMMNKLDVPLYLHFSLMNRSEEIRSSTFYIGAKSSYTLMHTFTMPPSQQVFTLKVEDLIGNIIFQKTIKIDPVTVEKATPSACPWIKLVEFWPGSYGPVSTSQPPSTQPTEQPVVTVSIIDYPPSSASAGDILKWSFKAHNGKDVPVKVEMVVEYWQGDSWRVVDNSTYTVQPHSDQIMEALVQKEINNPDTYRVTIREKPGDILYQQEFKVYLALFKTAKTAMLPLPDIYVVTTQAVPPGGMLAGTFWISNPTKLDAEISVYIPFYNPDGSLADFGVLTAYQVPPSSRFPVTFVLKPPSAQTMRVRVGQACPTDYTKRTVALFKTDPSTVYEIFDLMGIPPSAIPSFFFGGINAVMMPSGKLNYPFSSCEYPSRSEIPGESIPVTIDYNQVLDACSLTYSAPSYLRPGDTGSIIINSNCSVAVGQLDPSINVAPGVDLLGIYQPGAYHKSPYTINFTMPNHDVTFMVWASSGSNCIVSARSYITVKVNKTGTMFWISSLTYDQFAKPHTTRNVTLTVENRGTAGGTAIIKVGNSSQSIYLNAGEKKQVVVSYEMPERSFSMPVILTDSSGRIYEKHSFNIYTTAFIKPLVSLEYPAHATNYATITLNITNAGDLTPGIIWYKLVSSSGALLASGSLSTLKNDRYIVSIPLKISTSGLNVTLTVGHKDPEETKTDYTQQIYIEYKPSSVEARVENLTYPRTALPSERINVSFWAYSNATEAFWVIKDSRNGSVYASGTLSSEKQFITVPMSMPYYSLDLNLSLVHRYMTKNVTDYEITFYIMLENGTGLAPGSFARGSRIFMPLLQMPSAGIAISWKIVVMIILILLILLFLFMRKLTWALAALILLLLIALPLFWAIILSVIIIISAVLFYFLKIKE